MKPLVIVPTYNEKENIGELLPKILSSAPGAQILVVDDESEDGTVALAEEIGKKLPGVHVLRRKGARGRGLAGIEGFQWALRKGFDPILEMDADLSHDPAMIPLFFKEIEQHEVVVGSRFIRGGSQEARSMLRVLLSGCTSRFLRLLLGFKVLDGTSGFRCFRRSVLEEIRLDRMISKGPSIVIEILYACHQQGFDLAEIPIVFKNRKKGRTKLNFIKLLDALGVVIRLRCGFFWSFFK